MSCADINDTGDGIVIRDTAFGATTLTVAEVDSTSAADLNLLGTAKTVNIGGQDTQVIDGSTTRTVTLTADDTLATLAGKINTLGPA